MSKRFTGLIFFLIALMLGNSLFLNIDFLKITLYQIIAVVAYYAMLAIQDE